VSSAEIVKKRTNAFSETLAGQTVNLESEIVRVLKQVEEIQGPDELIERQISEQLLPLSTAMQSSAHAIEQASSTFTSTITLQKAALESQFANLSTRIGEVRMPADKVEAALDNQIAAFNEMLLKNRRIIEAATSEFANTLSKQLPALTTLSTDLSNQIRHLGSNSKIHSNSNKGRWWLFGR
jgi:hypothetical protein